MSAATVSVIFILFAVYVGFQVVKNFQLRNLNKALAQKDYDLVEKLAVMGLSRKLLGQYNCDLYQLRALYLGEDVPRFEALLRQMIATEYKNPADKKSFLEQYFHTFLLRENKQYADWLLEAIRAFGDEVFTRYNEQAYAVMIEKRSDLIETMDHQIDAKQYYGFSLGVILFMIARQYEYLNDTANAVLYYKNAKICFHPKAIYVPVIESCIERLEQPEERETARA